MPVTYDDDMASVFCDNLNENEKEALHLLLQGHDAKTAAREIGVTPNVINERLRSARQKLQVTSSKAAARMLAEHEGYEPKNFVPKNIGIAQQQFIPCLDIRQRRQTGSGKYNRHISLMPLSPTRSCRFRFASRENWAMI